jgi:hypothetical protein
LLLSLLLVGSPAGHLLVDGQAASIILEPMCLHVGIHRIAAATCHPSHAMHFLWLKQREAQHKHYDFTNDLELQVSEPNNGKTCCIKIFGKKSNN